MIAMKNHDGNIQTDLKGLYTENRVQFLLGRLEKFLWEWGFVTIVLTGMVIAIVKLF
jgi:hypothetical protein